MNEIQLRLGLPEPPRPSEVSHLIGGRGAGCYQLSRSVDAFRLLPLRQNSSTPHRQARGARLRSHHIPGFGCICILGQKKTSYPQAVWAARSSRRPSRKPASRHGWKERTLREGRRRQARLWLSGNKKVRLGMQQASLLRSQRRTNGRPARYHLHRLLFEEDEIPRPPPPSPSVGVQPKQVKEPAVEGMPGMKLPRQESSLDMRLTLSLSVDKVSLKPPARPLAITLDRPRRAGPHHQAGTLLALAQTRVSERRRA